MKTLLHYVLFLGLSTTLSASPQADLQQLRQFYQARFPQLQLADYAQGVYALDPIAKQSWTAINEFPPYQPVLEQGEILFKTPFKNGRHYSNCFENQGVGITQTYPRWNSQQGEVQTLLQAINQCRLQHGETAFNYQTPEIIALSAYLAYISRGQTLNILIPENDARAIAAYEAGKSYYYQRRGQLNFACATCHIENAGQHIRAEILSPLVGHTSGWPTYRLKWGEVGILHRRIIGCHEQIRALAPPIQSKELRQLEYFMSFMSNGVPITGPSTRK